jgi:hypothetical protein
MILTKEALFDGWRMLQEEEDKIEIEDVEPYFQGSYCCLVTGEVVRYLGSHYGYAILQVNRGYKGGMRFWWLYIGKTVWESYLRFVDCKGYKRGEGPFRPAMAFGLTTSFADASKSEGGLK